MKKIVKLFLIMIIIFTVSCEKETLNIEETNQVNPLEKGIANSSTEELIILYPDGTTEFEKQMKRAEYGVVDYKKCECADENLELWIFSNSNSGHINIEEKKQTARVDEEIEGADLNPILQIHEDAFTSVQLTGLVDDALPNIVTTNTGVTVAVLDTGIDYNYQGFPSSYLYNSSSDDCSYEATVERFGWNFVSNNNNPYDDYPGKHGTIITSIITSNLESHNVSYQILPVKVANHNGNINYFDALCGFQYAVNKENVRVVNMSFGWYNNNHKLLSKFIEAVQNDILVVTSAGNDYSNNDVIPHFPSSYDAENVLAIGGVEEMKVYDSTNGPQVLDPRLAIFSNHGINSVDLAAESENIPFLYDNQTFYVNGTSYSAAFASAFSAFHYQNGMNVSTLKNTILSNSVYSYNLQEIKYSAYIHNY